MPLSGSPSSEGRQLYNGTLADLEQHGGHIATSSSPSQRTEPSSQPSTPARHHQESSSSPSSNGHAFNDGHDSSPSRNTDVPSGKSNPHTYDPRHTIPTIKKYYEEKEARHKDNEDGALTEDQLRGAKDVLKREDREDGEDDEDEEARLKAMVDKQMKSNGYTDAENDTRGRHAAGNYTLSPYLPAKPISLPSLLSPLKAISLSTVFLLPPLLSIILFPKTSWFRLLLSTVFLSALGTIPAYFAWDAQRRLEKEVELIRVDMHRQRAEAENHKAGKGYPPESVEWLNAVVATIWGLIDPSLFNPTSNLVEDVMQASLPKLVDAVRISQVGQGRNPFRIVSMRKLPRRGKRAGVENDDVDEDMIKKEESAQGSSHINLEIAFAYLAAKDDSNKANNIHLLIEFFLGVYDWLHIPVPLWVQVERVVGTVRLRLQLIPDYPFVRNVTFSFMGVPAVDVSVVPLMKNLPNVLDLPLISGFVRDAIAAGSAEYVAPKSMTINVEDILLGAAIGDTRAVGVFIITLHHGKDLAAQDANGKSDPYIVAAYAKFGKPIYYTRVIHEDLNPVFEETLAVLLTIDEINTEESLSLMLWDSDTHSADDLIGRVQIDVQELIKDPNTMHRRNDKLQPFDKTGDKDHNLGELHWSCGFFPKAQLRKELEIPPDTPTVVLPKTITEMSMKPGDKAPNPAARDLPPPPADPKRTPPDPRWKSGVLSIIVHDIANLEEQDLKGKSGKKREGELGQDTDEAAEQSGNLPSAYCEIILNDDILMVTRTKQYSPQPLFEAGLERFLRDWENSVVRVVVRNRRLRENDPILGIVTLPLKEVFRESSEVTRQWPLEEGVGFGRVSISLLYRSIEVDLPPNLLGWETGTVCLGSHPIEIHAAPDHEDLIESFQTLVVSTSDTTEKLGKKKAKVEGEVATFDIDSLRLPVYVRYQSSLTFELFGRHSTRMSDPKAFALVWLQEIEDNVDRFIRIPIVRAEDPSNLKYNYLNDVCKETHDFEIIGWLTTSIKLEPGLDMDHEESAATRAKAHAFEAYDHVEGQAEVAERQSHFKDDGKISKDEAKEIKKAEKRQNKNRHRGIYAFHGTRMAIWMKDGVVNRVKPKPHEKKGGPTIASEVA